MSRFATVQKTKKSSKSLEKNDLRDVEECG